jgi:hypothetical protein
MRFACLLASLALLVGCKDDPAPGSTFYDENIQPILDQSCVRNVAGCHAANADDPFAFAAGNLDLTSFENVQKRRDVLRTFGAYPVPLLLMKAVGDTCELQIPYRDEFLCIENPHSGGPVMQVGSPAYLTLQTWMENGATQNGLPPLSPPEQGDGPCSSVVPPGFDETAALADPEFGTFRDDVMPILQACNSGNCHGAPQADFYNTCGDNDRQLAFNFEQAQAFVDDPVDNSELLQRPLAVSGGGYTHTGGDHFASRNAGNYETVRDWAEAVGRIEFGEGDPGKTFFAENVQPLLLSRGCSFEACHSPQAFNDFKLRSGSRGFFSAVALERNYELLKGDFMAMEYADSRAGRAVSKGIFETNGGIGHRGGGVLETIGGGPSLPSSCPAVYDPATATAFCTFQEWVDIERAAMLVAGDVTPMGDGDTIQMVYVDRSASHVATPLEFDTYQPGSSLMRVSLTIGPDGSIAGVGTPADIGTSCPGTQATRDLSAPDVNIDGQTIVFSMRTSAAEPRQLYTVDLSGVGCTVVTPDDFPTDVDGMLVHAFDPVWSPDGDYLVFAASRAGTVSRALFLPQSDIWRMRANGSEPEQVTVLHNSEISPDFMREGRMIMSTEKVSDGFYQISGRRINWDLTDYHPLLAQRSQSRFCDPDDLSVTCPSVDYEQATDVREGSNGNFLLILSDPGARAGAGTLATFNRSVGPFEAGRNDEGFMKSMIVVDPAATGRAGAATDGAYRSPISAPDGGIIVSYAPVTGDLGSISSIDYDLVYTTPCVPPAPGASCTPTRTPLITGAGQQVEPVLAIKRPAHTGYLNRRQLVFGGGVDTDVTGGADFAQLHMIDAPTTMTLFTANLRRGRPGDAFRNATQMSVYEETAPPAGTTTGNVNGIYQNRVKIGSAPLEADGSVKILLRSRVPVVLALEDDNGNTLLTMTETHQLGPGETVSMGVATVLFDAVCAGCHGSVSGRELDVIVTPDALTGASESIAQGQAPTNLAP